METDSGSDSDHDKVPNLTNVLGVKKESVGNTNDVKFIGANRVGNIFVDAKQDAGQLIVLVGKSEKGKTHFLKWIILNQIATSDKPFQFGLVFVKTKYKHSYDFVPDKKIIQGYNEKILRKYALNLERIFEQTGSVPPNFVIFDDLVGILGNNTQWFVNWISTYRHLNTTIYIAVQYLTGKNAISPIMREQTTIAVMFNSKTRRTVENLYESYGQLFATIKEFQQYYFNATEIQKVGPYVAMVYIEKNEDLSNNYLSIRAPAKLPEIKMEF